MAHTHPGQAMAQVPKTDGTCPKAKTDHDWELVYRDGPTDSNDWKCRACGEMAYNRGPDPPR